jgi:hypothetical protein
MPEVVMRISGGQVQRNPTEHRIRALVGALRRDDYVVLEEFGKSTSSYIQLWVQSGGMLQLEYRAGGPSEHYQTRTKSRDDAAAALYGWSKGESAWQADFEWISIGDWFDK